MCIGIIIIGIASEWLGSERDRTYISREFSTLCDKHCILFLFILKQVSTLHGYDGIDENGRDGGAQMSNILESSLTIE